MLPKIKGERYKLDCVKVLENLLAQAGYQLKIEERATMNDCAAFTIPDMNMIVFREDIYDLLHRGHVFGRSTVIHEMAHLVLRHSATLHRGAKLGEHGFFEDSEWQAKSLTAAIMMPIEACKISRSAGELATMCGTSASSASFRLERLTKDRLL